MKSDQLHDLWISPDNSHLTPRQFSFRLPVHVAAKVAALCEMYPYKTRTQIVADLLTSALDELEKDLPQALGQPLPPEEQYQEQENAALFGETFEEVYTLGGPRGRFRDLSNKHHREIEKELGNDSPEILYRVMYITKSELADKN